jgi:hypothetical protein
LDRSTYAPFAFGADSVIERKVASFPGGVVKLSNGIAV